MNITGVVKFEGSNCGACKAMEPTWKRIQEKNTNVNFQKIKVEENPELTEHYSIIAVPTFMAIKEGEELERVIGITNEKGLQNLINLLV